MSVLPIDPFAGRLNEHKELERLRRYVAPRDYQRPLSGDSYDWSGWWVQLVIATPP
jgi:hypothetical protein